MTDLSQRRAFMTAEDLYALPSDLQRYELVNGELRVGEPTGIWHGSLAIDLGGELRALVRAERLGLIVGETGFLLRRDPDTVRAPDVAFIRAERVPDFERGERYFDGAPDLAAEIVSPGDTAAEVTEKVEDYLASGTRLVWVVYPRSRHVVVWTPDRVGRTLGAGGTLEGADVVPGVRLPLRDLFSSLPNAEAPRA